MAVILHMMGPTCAGKSTLIDSLKSQSSDVYSVQIGKILRMKYGEAFFKGQAAPEHTRDEAQQLYFDCINEGIGYGKKLILVDGQPRDLGQAETMMASWPDHRSEFILVHAPHEVRELRAKAGRAVGPDLDLALARLNNDYRNCYIVLTRLLERSYRVNVVDTGATGFDVHAYAAKLLRKYVEVRDIA